MNVCWCFECAVEIAAVFFMEACVVVQVVMRVPQNDVLANPNLRAFLSRVGINSMYEVCAEVSDGANML